MQQRQTLTPDIQQCPTRIAILASGNGSNCENIARYFSNVPDITVALVITNRHDAYVLTRAEKLGIPNAVMPKAEFNDEEKIVGLLECHQIDFIVLAGFLLMIPDFLVKRYHRRMVNIHPALLPKFGGKGMYGRHVQEAVKAAGEEETGITIHWVSEECDGGDIIAQFSTKLSPNDSIDDITNKVHALEIAHYPKTIERIVRAM